MPFGQDCEFADMDACVQANDEKDDPEAYCATLMRETEDRCASESESAAAVSGSIRLQVLSRAIGAFAAIDPIAASVWLARNPVSSSPRAAAERRSSKRSGVVAVLPLYGYLTPHASMFEQMLGASSTLQWGQVFEELIADDQIRAVVIDVDSPGGDVTGMNALSETVFSARGAKPVVAVSNGLNASAAYGISSAAAKLWADPDSLTGSIGTVYEHIDASEALARQGIKVEYITYGKYKAELGSALPLSDEAREYLQGITNSYGEDFVRRVATNRKISLTKVRNEFGQGRVMRAKDALAVGMVDRVGTLREALAELGGSPQIAAPSEPPEFGDSAITPEPIDPVREQRWRQIQTNLALNLPERRARRGVPAQGG